ncbi:hypothetical protein MXD63_36085, partial [Frankia sp. Cpl3]|nr:hypothetical protein [Frankia sp. Cpl3]
ALEWEQELGALLTEIHTSEQELSELLKLLHTLTEQMAEDERRLARSEQELAELDEQLKQATVSPEERSFINQLREVKREWERELARQRELTAEFSAMQSEWNALGTETEKLQASWKKAVGAREQAEQAIAALEAKPTVSDHELERLREQLSQIKSLGREWREQLNLLEEWDKKWAGCEQLCSQAERVTQDAAAELQKQEALRDETQKRFQQLREEWQNWQHANMARHLRDRLHDGEDCPVCGSAHHPYRLDGHSHQQADDEREAVKWQEKLSEGEAALAKADQLTRSAAEKWQTAKIDQA